MEEVINLKPPAGSSFNNLTSLTFSGIVSRLIQLALVISAIVFFFMLVVGGIKWILSGGDKSQTEGARNQITAALVGLIIVFAAWAIVQLVQSFFNVNILEGLNVQTR